MSSQLYLNALLSLPESFEEKLVVNELYTISKSGFRITPFKMPMELSTHDHKYLGKVVVVGLNVDEENTTITFKVLKIFTEEESKVYSDNFLRY